MPVIGPDSVFQTQSGNKLSKSNTVICRGTGNDRLSEFGHNFTLTVHPHNEHLFVLNGDAEEVPMPEEIAIPENESEEETVDNLLDTLDSEKIDKEEINADDFDFTL